MEHLEYLLLGVFGVVLHSLFKCKSLNEDAIAANLQFSFVRDYIQKDFYGLLASLLSPLIWYFIFAELAAKYPSLENFVLTSFFVMGFMGSYIFQLALGRMKKQIRRVVDEKTNIADGIEPSDKP